MSELLSVKDLSTCIRGETGVQTVIEDVSLHINSGETLGLVGESGSGKSITALSVMGLLPQPDSFIARGSIEFNGTNLRTHNQSQLASLRGSRISMIFQDPMTALNPVQRIGKQIAETLLIHNRFARPGKALNRRVVELLASVGIPQPDLRKDNYPHQLSGGMRQRVMIAMALACEPELLIADEPTTALDVTVQAQILQLIKSLQREHNMAMLFITHDLGLISQISDRVAVMYAGQIVESATARELFEKPLHPYTKALLASSPSARSGHKQKLAAIPGTVAKPEDYGRSCRFYNRCGHSKASCNTTEVITETVNANHEVRCLRWSELAVTEDSNA